MILPLDFSEILNICRLYFIFQLILSKGTTLIRKSVRDFFKTKGFIRILDGFSLKTKGFLPKVYEILGSEMPLAFYNVTSPNF